MDHRRPPQSWGQNCAKGNLRFASGSFLASSRHAAKAASKRSQRSAARHSTMQDAAAAVGGPAKRQRVHEPGADLAAVSGQAGCADHEHVERAGEESSCSSQCMGSCGRGDREEEATDLGCSGCTRAPCHSSRCAAWLAPGLGWA